MERQPGLQLELFTSSGNSGGLKPRAQGNPFLKHLRAYEKTLLIIIGIAVTSIISFSLGVEKGKQVALKKNNAAFDIALKTNEAGLRQPLRQPAQQNVPAAVKVKPNVQPVIKPVVPVTEDRNIVAIPPVKATMGSYTVQVASYKTRSYAQKEAQALEKQGFSTVILSKGNYIVLCVGNFNSKEKAQSLVSQLQKRYQGCMVRRL
jgi:cell division protein FtsN